MHLWLVAPVKSLHAGKSRLASSLTAEQRYFLNYNLLFHLLTTAVDAGVVTETVVVSHDAEALLLAEQLGASGLPERGCRLNQALDQGRSYALRHGANALLVLPIDLPLLTSADIQTLYQMGDAGEGVVIVPSRQGGTNALLLRPPHLLKFSFGRQSFQRHVQLAQTSHIACRIYSSATLAWDLDLPEDLPSVPEHFLRKR
jgi:2-phospho-L-lactate guanylyltransferase